MTKKPNDVVIYHGVDSETGLSWTIVFDEPEPIRRTPKESERWND